MTVKGQICRNLYEENKEQYKKADLYFQDESRLDLSQKKAECLQQRALNLFVGGIMSTVPHRTLEHFLP